MTSCSHRAALLGLGAVVIFAIDLWSRFHLSENSNLPLLLSVIGVVTFEFGGWSDGEMVSTKGMAVEAAEKLTKKKNDREQPRLRRES